MKQKLLHAGQVITTFLARFFHRKRLIRYAIYLSILLILYLCRVPVLRGLGNHLITEDEIQHADAVYVLGGSSCDRAQKAIELYKKGYSKNFICTGKHVSKEFQLVDTILTEAEITASFLIKGGIPKYNVIILSMGSSTREESEIIYDHVKGKFDKIIILTSKFHLRRTRNVFEEKFENSPVELVFIGAPSSEYEESNWWRHEKGLIMVNNEYMKLFYYWWTE